MSAGFHECRRCHGSLNHPCNCNRNAGNVPVKPLTSNLSCNTVLLQSRLMLQSQEISAVKAA